MAGTTKDLCNGICKSGSMCTYKSKMIDSNGKHFCGIHARQGDFEETDCSICMEEICKYAVTLTKCKHVFHTKCLKHWTTNFNTSCPLCRCTIPGKPKQIESNNQQSQSVEMVFEIETRMSDLETRMNRISDLETRNGIQIFRYSDIRSEIETRMSQLSAIRRTLFTEFEIIQV